MIEALKVGDMLPDIVIARADGDPVALRAARGETTVIVACSGCGEYLQALADVEEEFRIWEARLIVLHRQSDRVIVADKFGQVFYVEGRLTPPRQLTEWLKYLGTLCPE